MAEPLTPTQSLKEIQTLLHAAGGNAESFLLSMKEAQLPSLSFSKVSAVESCQHRFYLQYILHLELDPIPDYFIKGKLLHTVIAHSYQKLSNHLVIDLDEYFELISQTTSGQNQTHLMNAARVHLENLWEEVEVVGIETPFAMLISTDLPPIIGVIDLILHQGGHYLVIDHKSGRDFYPPDELQMAIYRQYIHHQFDVEECEFFYEHYRWVNNLQRIRKPAFLRSALNLPADGWQASLDRICRAYGLMQRIRETNDAQKNGDCYRCPYRKIC
jgi:ATP-dependent exoDNAse (exonuclease V) beta subunit